MPRLLELGVQHQWKIDSRDPGTGDDVARTYVRKREGGLMGDKNNTAKTSSSYHRSGKAEGELVGAFILILGFEI